MAFSDSISGTTFNALKVVDHAFRRCRLSAQQITSEMQSYALDSLAFMLSDLANTKAPSWCIEKVILPFYENQPIVPLPVGTVDVLNLNYRTIQTVTGTDATTPAWTDGFYVNAFSAPSNTLLYGSVTAPNITVGQLVVGEYIPEGTIITSIDYVPVLLGWLVGMSNQTTTAVNDIYESLEFYDRYVSIDFGSPTIINTVGINWPNTSVATTFQVSNDGSTWTTVGSSSEIVSAGTIVWDDIDGALPYQYFKITGLYPYQIDSITFGNTPSEVPFGELNRDSYVQQNNQVFSGRPVTYWFQRDIPIPVVHLWPAPNAASEQAQCILWRHRHIMDTENLQQEVEVPQRWLEAIINGLAARVAAESPQVDANLVPVLEQRAAISLQRAWDGDNDGSPTFINPGIGCYTK